MLSFRQTVVVFACFVVTGCTTRSSWGEGLAPSLLKELRAATVLIQVNENGTQSTGTGFLIRKDGERGFILTNHHVVGVGKNSKIKVVFQSGTSEEISLATDVVASNDAIDLSLLRVESSALPTPLRMADGSMITETMNTHLFGFPFGAELGGSRNNPEITISQASVSSLRKDDDDQLELIQLDGNLNPGNSGGPVVNQQGDLLGVAVATIRNAGIGFAIPVQTVKKFLAGDIVSVTVSSSKVPMEYGIDVTLSDPFEQIKTIAGEITTTPGRTRTFTCDRKGLSASAFIWIPDTATSASLTMHAQLVDGTVIDKPALDLPLRKGKLTKAITSRTKSPAPLEEIGKKTGLAASKPVDFGGKVIAIAASPNGTGAFVIREGKTSNELVFWDAASNTIANRIQVPRSPTHLGVFDGNILVTCPESAVIALVDPATKKVTNAAQIKGPGKPFRVCQTIDTKLAYVLTTPNGGEPERQASVVEVNFETRENRTVFSGDVERASISGEHLACQENFGGSPSGVPRVVNTTNAVPPNVRGRSRFPHKTFGLFHPIKGGSFVASNDERTIAFPADSDTQTTTWATDGTLLTAWADKSKFLLTQGDDLTNPDSLPLIAVSQSGKVLWKADIPVGTPVSMFLTKNIFLHNRHKKLLVGTARHGSILTVAQRIAADAVSQAHVVGSGESDHLLFCVSTYQANIHSRFGMMIDEGERQWFTAELPASGVVVPGTARTNSPSSKVKVGDDFVFSPTLDQPRGKLVLVSAPDGMKIDPKTGKIQWATTVSSLGRWDIEIVDRTADGDESVMKFDVTVEF